MRDNHTLARLYIDAALGCGLQISLRPDHLHYLKNVLRLALDSELRVFNGRDGEWRAEISSLGKKAGQIRIIEQLRVPYSAPDIWLVFAPLRKQRNGFVLEKATELGVSKIIPVITDRTQHSKSRLDKMRAQIIEAAEQTERLDLPELEAPVTLSALLASWPKARNLVFADEGGDGGAALEVLQNMSGSAALLIGPEGGFTDKERDGLRAHHFVTSVGLGPRILRADTAALSLLTLWQAAQGDWKANSKSDMNG